MPNHIHILVEIKNNTVPIPAVPQPRVFERKPKSISSFVAGFKSTTTKQINEKNKIFNGSVWQSNYHDHIVRNYESFRRIHYYIKSNPVKWEEDKHNKNAKL